MKNLRHLCAAFALTFMLALSASAGEIELPGVTSTSTTTVTTMSSHNAGSTSITETVLNLLQGVLSLL